MKRVYFHVLTLVAALSVISAARADDNGLYPDAPPPGSAFVRFLNGGGNESAAIAIAGKSYGQAPLGAVTRYVPVPQGETSLAFGGKEESAQLQEDKHYCAVLARGKLTVLEEPSEDNPLKAEIMLINASSRQDVSLKTKEGVDVVQATDPGMLGGRAVNAVKVPLSVYAGGRKLEDIEARDLARGARYAVVVYDAAGGKAAVTFN